MAHPSFDGFNLLTVLGQLVPDWTDQMDREKQGTLITFLHLDQEVLAHDAIELRRPGCRNLSNAKRAGNSTAILILISAKYYLPSLRRYHETSTTMQKSSMEIAGKDFFGASPILKCMATAPIINAAIIPAAGMITMGYHRPTKRRAAEISFIKPTPYIRLTGSPYAANSCFILLEAAPRQAVGLSKRSSQTLKIPRATKTCSMILVVSIKEVTSKIEVYYLEFMNLNKR